MARILPLWRSDEISLYRFDHPVEHEDQPYEARADAFRASFEGKGFNDTCISLIYLAAEDERFHAARNWARPERRVLQASNRLRYLRWLLQRAVAQRAPMLAEYAASEIFREPGAPPAALFREHKFGWYAERIHAARERLDAEYDGEHSVSALARSIGMSAFHFTRVFTQLVGRPPHRYLTERRLAAARAMLTDGRSVTETCFACGFNDLSHFSRSFRRRFGVPPSRLLR